MSNLLMTHLVINYPNPQAFEDAFVQMLESKVNYVELQLPFTNPVADGPVIYKANQTALKYNNKIVDNIEKIGKIISKYKSEGRLESEIFLMSYFTPVLSFGIKEIVELLKENGFSGAIIPDLGIDTKEFPQLNELCKLSGLQLVPVISPITSLARVNQYKEATSPGQLVYAVARAGKTGIQTTDIQDPTFSKYINSLKDVLSGCKLAVGFGISTQEQVDFLNQQGVIAVIGSQIVNKLDNGESLENYLNYLKN